MTDEEMRRLALEKAQSLAKKPGRRGKSTKSSQPKRKKRRGDKQQSFDKKPYFSSNQTTHGSRNQISSSRMKTSTNSEHRRESNGDKYRDEDRSTSPRFRHSPNSNTSSTHRNNHSHRYDRRNVKKLPQKVSAVQSYANFLTVDPMYLGKKVWLFDKIKKDDMMAKTKPKSPSSSSTSSISSSSSTMTNDFHDKIYNLPAIPDKYLPLKKRLARDYVLKKQEEAMSSLNAQHSKIRRNKNNTRRIQRHNPSGSDSDDSKHKSRSRKKSKSNKSKKQMQQNTSPQNKKQEQLDNSQSLVANSTASLSSPTTSLGNIENPKSEAPLGKEVAVSAVSPNVHVANAMSPTISEVPDTKKENAVAEKGKVTSDLENSENQEKSPKPKVRVRSFHPIFDEYASPKLERSTSAAKETISASATSSATSPNVSVTTKTRSNHKTVLDGSTDPSSTTLSSQSTRSVVKASTPTVIRPGQSNNNTITAQHIRAGLQSITQSPTPNPGHSDTNAKMHMHNAHTLNTNPVAQRGGPMMSSPTITKDPIKHISLQQLDPYQQQLLLLQVNSLGRPQTGSVKSSSPSGDPPPQCASPQQHVLAHHGQLQMVSAPRVGSVNAVQDTAAMEIAQHGLAAGVYSLPGVYSLHQQYPAYQQLHQAQLLARHQQQVLLQQQSALATGGTLQVHKNGSHPPAAPQIPQPPPTIQVGPGGATEVSIGGLQSPHHVIHQTAAASKIQQTSTAVPPKAANRHPNMASPVPPMVSAAQISTAPIAQQLQVSNDAQQHVHNNPANKHSPIPVPPKTVPPKIVLPGFQPPPTTVHVTQTAAHSQMQQPPPPQQVTQSSTSATTSAPQSSIKTENLIIRTSDKPPPVVPPPSTIVQQTSATQQPTDEHSSMYKFMHPVQQAAITQTTVAPKQHQQQQGGGVVFQPMSPSYVSHSQSFVHGAVQQRKIQQPPPPPATAAAHQLSSVVPQHNTFTQVDPSIGGFPTTPSTTRGTGSVLTPNESHKLPTPVTSAGGTPASTNKTTGGGGTVNNTTTATHQNFTQIRQQHSNNVIPTPPAPPVS